MVEFLASTINSKPFKIYTKIDERINFRIGKILHIAKRLKHNQRHIVFRIKDQWGTVHTVKEENIKRVMVLETLKSLREERTL